MDEQSNDQVLDEKIVQQREAARMMMARREISLQLDTYDDIFSDFDPRPYEVRSLSVDFLTEASRAARDKSGHLQLQFLIPHEQKNTALEVIIRRRLHEHFHRHLDLLRREQSKEMVRGIVFVAVGILAMVAATFLGFMETHTIWAEFLFVILEPAGWFNFWTGLERILDHSQKNKDDLEFYRKMTSAEIHFEEY